MRMRPGSHGKFSVLPLVGDHYDTLRNFSSGRPSPADYLMFLGLPASAAVVCVLLDGQMSNVPQVLAAVTILTGLIFTVFGGVFNLAVHVSEHREMEDRRLALRLAGEVRANVSYAVLIGLLLSALLGGLAMFADTNQRLSSLLSAVVTFGGLHLLLSIFMILKRIRAVFLLLGARSDPPATPTVTPGGRSWAHSSSVTIADRI